MSKLNIRPGRNVRKSEFEQFTLDLQLFLNAFCAAQLARWMGRDKGNLSKKLNGIEPITTKDLVDFYGTASSVITKLEKGVPVFQIEQDMTLVDDNIKVEPTKNMWEELGLVKETLKKQHAVIKTLKWRLKRSKKRKYGRRRSQ
ncbi:MAG TPA: hypothetical protein VHE34_16425 [Puia sp.]|uniref:hypothetical protein n=1 Tax=Puia sp. TaxID=2045100 RepID=UPI002D12319E|nr:hypothetical protein [Puia sp.]HVU96817.1 hypothetical protein [Puia sp.]